MRIGITIKPMNSIGDRLQFSSLPENYFRAKGEKLVDVDKSWFFDANPFVERDIVPDKTIEMWNFCPTVYEWPDIKREGRHNIPKCYTSNAEIWCAVFGVPCVMNRVRLYQHEDFPFHKREKILLQTIGRSHGEMPEHVIQHIIHKYAPTGRLYHVGPERGGSKGTYGLPSIATPTLWDFAKLVSEARMFIGLDSGPSWIAACYPDVVVKKLRTRPQHDILYDWIPLEQGNIHSFWDDRCHMVYNTSEKDIGFTWSYKRM